MASPDFPEVTVSAPSKLILHGEHSVVYGKTAIACSLDMRTRMTLSPNNENCIQVDFADIGVFEIWSIEKVKEIVSKKPEDLDLTQVDQYFLDQIHDFLRIDETNLRMASLTCFFYLYSAICDDIIPMKIKVESEIPVGAGLGSSAALSVCLAAGLLAIKNRYAFSKDAADLCNKQVCQFAFLSEKILHGNPSGIDNAVSTYGGIIKFQSGSVTPIPSIPKFRILLVNTNISRNTKTMVEGVRNKFLSVPKVVKPIMDALDGVSLTCIQILEHVRETGDTKHMYEKLEELIDYNQNLLSTLGVSHPEIDRICHTVAKEGLHAKLTGAGGGGFVFVLVPPYAAESSVTKIKDTLNKSGFTCWETSMGVNGVKIQRKNS